MRKVALSLVVLFVMAMGMAALAQDSTIIARETFVTGKRPAASFCQPGTLTLWFDGTSLRQGTRADCTTWPVFPSALGAVTGTTFNKVTITAPAASATLTIANTKTLTVNNTMTLAGTDGSVYTLPGVTASLAPLTSPTFVTPTLGAAAGTSLNLGGATLTDVLTNTAVIDFAAITTATCSDGGTTITVAGAVDGDSVMLGVPAALGATADVVWSARVSAADTVTVRGCKVSAGDTADLASGTFRATILKF